MDSGSRVGHRIQVILNFDPVFVGVCIKRCVGSQEFLRQLNM